MVTSVAQFQKVSLGYGRSIVLKDLTLQVERGDFLGIVGPNGAGKTTLLKAILGMLPPINGAVHRDVSVTFGYIPQQQRLDDIFPLTVMEVAMMGRYPLMGVFGRAKQRDETIVMQSLEHVGVADLAGRLFRELSGGQKQRVLIARALAGEPRALVLDEPTNDMDIASEYAIMELLRQLNEKEDITVVMVSHLLNVVANYAKNLVIIDDGGARVGVTEQMMSPEQLSATYGVTVTVAICGGKRVAFAGGEHD